MMNWDAILTTLWNKVSKPITNVFIGLAFLIFAPDNVNWFGWIFLAIGVGGFLDKQSQSLSKKWERFQRNNKIKEELKHLTRAEESILKLMVQRNKRVMRKPDFENALLNERQKRSIHRKLPDSIYDIFTSLQDKELVYWDAGLGGGFSVTARDCIWEIIKKRYKADFNTANKREQT